MPEYIHIRNLWSPALEILILAVLIYFVFRFVRGTRGWPVVIGFVVVLLALALVTTILDSARIELPLCRHGARFAGAPVRIAQRLEFAAQPAFFSDAASVA